MLFLGRRQVDVSLNVFSTTGLSEGIAVFHIMTNVARQIFQRLLFFVILQNLERLDERQSALGHRTQITAQHHHVTARKMRGEEPHDYAPALLTSES